MRLLLVLVVVEGRTLVCAILMDLRMPVRKMKIRCVQIDSMQIDWVQVGVEG